jgi:hypothetical protein
MIRAILRNAGVRPARLLSAIRSWNRYRRDRANFRQLAGQSITWGRELPILNEWNESSGSLSPYLLQDLTVARWIHLDQPRRHVDVGSRLDGFITQVASFRQIEAIDIRPSPGSVDGIVFHQLNIMEPLPDSWREATDSLSCLHTIEHFGLGRYGDPLDPAGHLKGLSRLLEMVAPGGWLYLSTPMGPERVEFNAHRVFAAATIFNFFEDWKIERFSFIDDKGELHHDPCRDGEAIRQHFGCKLGLAIIAARKAKCQ